MKRIDMMKKLFSPISWSYDLLRRQFDTARTSAYFLLLLGFGAAFIGYLQQYVYSDVFNFLDNPIADFYANASAELISIAITVLIIDRANRKEAERERKRELILRMGSPDNTIAREAVRRLRQEKWLMDGSLENADLSNADLQNAVLKDANLRKTRLMHTKLGGAKLTNADLEEAILFSAELEETVFIRSNLQNAVLSHVEKMQGARFPECNLQGADLSRTNIRDVSFESAKLCCADLSQAIIQETGFFGADLSNTKIRNATFQNVGFVCTDLRNADLRNASLQNVVLACDLRGARLEGVTLEKITWQHKFEEGGKCVAMLPDGHYWTPDRDMREFTHPEEWRTEQEQT